jgi:type I restriction enzyme S subunit
VNPQKDDTQVSNTKTCHNGEPRAFLPGSFAFTWEQRKLGDVKDVRDGTHDSPKYHNDGFPLVTSKNLSDNGLDMSDVSLISRDDYEAISRRSKVDVGDILFGMIGTIGNPVLLDTAGFGIKNVALIKSGGEVSNNFLIQLLKSPVFDKYIQFENAGGTQKFLGLSKIRDFVFYVPSIIEQNKIGSFFTDLDNLITLHQREPKNIIEEEKLCCIKQEKQSYSANTMRGGLKYSRRELSEMSP